MTIEKNLHSSTLLMSSLIVMSFLPCVSSSANEIMTSGQAFEAFQMYHASIQDVSAVYTVTFIDLVNPENPEIKQEYYWANKGLMEILTFKHPARDGENSKLITRHCVYNGEFSTISSRDAAGKYLDGIILPGKANEFREFNPGYLLNSYLGISFFQLFENPDARIVGQEDIEGYSTIVVEFPDQRGLTIRCNFSLDHNFSPLRIEGYWNGKLNQSVHSIELKRFATDSGDVWFPVRAIWSSYPRSTGEHEHDQLFEVLAVEINTGLSDDLFQMVFPKGTWVDDRIINSRYRIE